MNSVGILNCRFTGDENNAAPVTFAERGDVVTRQAHAAHDIDVEQFLPFGVGQRLERLAHIHRAEIVDENIDFRDRLGHDARAFRGGQIAGDAAEHPLGVGFLDPGDCRIHAGPGPAVHPDMGAIFGEPGGDRDPDSGGRTGHQCCPARQIQIYGCPPSTRRFSPAATCTPVKIDCKRKCRQMEILRFSSTIRPGCNIECVGDGRSAQIASLYSSGP